MATTLATTFNLNNNLNSIDIVINGYVPSDIEGYFKITSPAGIYYNNPKLSGTPDVSGANRSFSISIPQDVENNLLQGAYSIVLEYGEPGNVISSLTQTFTFNYVKPTPTLKSSVDILKPMILSVDTTSYISSTVEPTITRDFRLQYPSSAGVADVVSTEDNVFSQTFYHMGLQPLQHSFKLTTDLLYDFGTDVSLNEFYVTDGFIFVDNVNVVNPLDDKAIYSTMSNMYNCYIKYVGKDVNKQNELKSNWEEMCSYVDMIDSALASGNGQDVAHYTEQILILGEACNCLDTTTYSVPQLVYGSGGALGAVISGALPIPADGADGVSITGAYINNLNELVFETNTENEYNVGAVSAGADGASTVSVVIDQNNHLIITLSSGEVIDAGDISTDLSGYLPLTGGTLSGQLIANTGITTNSLTNNNVVTKRFVKEFSWNMDTTDSITQQLTDIVTINDLANEYKYLSVISFTIEDSFGNIYNERGSQVYYTLSATEIEIIRESGSFFNSPLFTNATVRIVVEHNKSNI